MLRTDDGGARCELLRVTRFAPSVHALGAAQLVAWGATFYALPPLLPHIGKSLDVTLSTLSLAITIGLVLNALGSLAVAAWIRRSGARVVMVTGSVAASLALVILAASPNRTLAFASLALLGAAHAALLYEPAFAAVAMQTRDPIARSRAIHILTFWGGWAALWALPSSSLLASWLGWRPALLVLATLLAGFTIRVHVRLPRVTTRSRAPLASRPPPISIGLATAFTLASFTTTGIVVHGLLLLGDREVSPRVGALVLAALAVPQVLGRLWFLRRGGARRHDGSIPLALVAFGIVALLGAPSIAALAVFVVAFGAGAGLLTTTRATVVVGQIAPEHVARQLAVYSFVASLGRAVAPAGASWLYFSIGYERTLVALAALASAAAILVWRYGLAAGSTCTQTSVRAQMSLGV